MNIKTIQSVGETSFGKQSRLWQKFVKAMPKIALYLVMLGLAYIFLYPFLYMVITSVKSNADLNNPLVMWIPRSLHFGNYSLAATIMGYWNNLKNTVLVTVLSTLGQLISCSMAGYSLARYKSYTHKTAFFFVILAMLVPPSTIIVPQYLLYANMGWLNTYLPLIIPSFFGFGLKGALFIYIFRQFFLSQPREIEEAARVDGCGFVRMFTRIVFPVARSIYIVVLVLALVWHWSDYFEPSMYINKSDMAMLSMRLQAISDTIKMFSADVLESSYGVNDTNTINNAVLMAGTFIVVLPVLFVYSLLQKQFIQGIERSGLTGE